MTDIEDRIDMTALEPEPHPPELALNDIGEVRLRTSGPLVFDGYGTNRLTGSFILIESGHQRHRRRRHALPAHRSRKAGIQRLRDLAHRLYGGYYPPTANRR